MTDAIVTDAEGSESTVFKTRHDEAYEALLARRKSEEVPIDEPEPPTPQDEPEEPTIDLIDAKGNIVKVPASAKYRAKIDGAEVEVPFEQVTRSYQVGAAADKRLSEASQRQKDLEAREREIEDRRKALEAQEKIVADQLKAKDKESDEPAKTDMSYRELAKKVLDALTYEDGESAEQALADALQGLSPKQAIDAEKIAAQAKQQALAEIEERERQRDIQEQKARQLQIDQKRLKANERFSSEFADVIEDPITYSAAKTLAKTKWDARPDADPWEIANEVGTEIRAWKKGLQPTKPKPPAAPRVATGRASIGKDPEPVTRESILAEMRKSRGQPV